MSQPINITDSNQVDLDRHGFIEASAGTGKTYTLERLVLRLLTETSDNKPLLSIEQILVVTFTEKAAGELRQRIQEKLAAELEKEPPGSDRGRRLRDNLARFDQCAIGTIHGFCQHLLQDFAFENNAPFESRLVDDRTVYRQALTELMRNQWPLQYGEDLADLLTLSGFSKSLQTLTQTVLTHARQYHPWAGDRILPASPDLDYPQLHDRFQSQVETIKTLLAAHPDPVAAFGRLNFHASSRRAQTEKMVRPLTDWILSLDHTPPRPVDFLPVWERFTSYGPFEKGGLNAVWPIAKWNKAGDNTAQVFPQLPRLTTALKALLETFDRLRALLVTQTIIDLQQAAGQEKRRNGWISYDDMLTQVHQALRSPTGGLLLDHLRQSFPFAFVDEFQDTDPVQWAIFKTIYLDDPQARGHLFLIGDPKQAIYAFRGADLFVYLEARRQFDDQVAAGRARRYLLNFNYRSRPELVTQFNRLFGDEKWFEGTGTDITKGITYTPAQSPFQREPSQQSVAPGRHALNVIDLSPARRLRQCRLQLCRFMAAEIANLTGPHGPQLYRAEIEETRPLDFGDIGVLVRGRGDAAPIEEALSQARIPYAFYRKQGLFDTAEAFHLSRVLRALASPGDTRLLRQALLTPFFEAALPDVAETSELPFDHPARQQLLQWQSLAEQRHWGRLFQSLVEASGLLFRGAAANSWERSAANYRQIFVHLTEKAMTEKLDLQGLCTLLDTRRTGADGDEDAPDTQEIETERAKVQILTLHMSKGLQFPVVFIAGGLTALQPSRGAIFHRYDDDGWMRVFDPLGYDTEKSARAESDQEDRRLYYVGLTRARQMLYLPYIDPEHKLRNKGPVLGWMAKGIKSALIDPGHCQPMAWNRPSPPAPGPDTAPEKPPSQTSPLPQPLLPPTVMYHPAGLRMTSFTRLQSQTATDQGGPGGFQPQSLMPTEADETDAFDETWDQHPQLPGGPTIGTFFHLLLEKIDYARAARLPHDAQTVTLIGQLMGRYAIDTAWRETIGDIVAATLNTPITRVGQNFRLADLPPAHRRHEVPFYYHFPPRAPRPETFARGSVDLIFRANDRYYVADWKSNRLPAYDPASLRMSMDQAGYHLQYRLYSLATLQWLRQVTGPGSRAQDHFGGVFYFYLRGMDAVGDQGIYFVPPEQIGSPESLETDIEAMLAKTGVIPGTGGRP